MGTSKASKSDEWIMVRILRATHASLRRWGRKWMDAGTLDMASRGNFGERDEPSLDAVVQELLRRDQDHRDRAKNNKRSRRVADQGDDAGEGE